MYKSQWNELIGPFYSENSVPEHTGQLIIQTITTDGTTLYPTMQFNEDGTVISGITDITRLLQECGLDGWGIALFLAQSYDSNPEPLISVLRKGDISHVMQIAQELYQQRIAIQVEEAEHAEWLRTH